MLSCLGKLAGHSLIKYEFRWSATDYLTLVDFLKYQNHQNSWKSVSVQKSVADQQNELMVGSLEVKIGIISIRTTN
jgi:hypothetical protein